MGNKLTGQATSRATRGQIEATVASIIPAIQEYIFHHEIAGSYRRGRKDAGDIDLVLGVRKGCATYVIDRLKEIGFSGGEKWLRAAYPMRGKGSGRGSAKKKVQIEVKMASAEDFWAQVMWATGSGAFNVALNARAKAQGYLRNQYGLWDGDKLIAADEAGIFAALGISFIAPEHRQTGSMPSADYAIVKVRSAVNIEDYYEVKVHRADGLAVWCSCKGFKYKQQCRHLEVAETKFKYNEMK